MRFYEGYIMVAQYEGADLEAMGIVLGDYDLEYCEFQNCLVPEDALEVIDDRWGSLIYGLLRLPEQDGSRRET